MGKLNEKVAVVTGGSSGIGLATARRFIADGAQVVITGRKQEALDAAVADLGDRATGIRGDVANLADLDRLFAEVQRQFGRVDVLFVNAAIAPFLPLEAVTEEHLDSLFDVNVRATKAAVRSLGRTLAAELAPRSIRVNVVSPGLIETPFWSKVGLSQGEVDALGEQVVGRTPLGRPGKPEEIAATVAFLASDDSSYFTGADLVADGGMIQV